MKDLSQCKSIYSTLMDKEVQNEAE